MNIQDWFPLELTGWISWQSKGLSRVFSNTAIWKYLFGSFKITIEISRILVLSSIIFPNWAYKYTGITNELQVGQQLQVVMGDVSPMWQIEEGLWVLNIRWARVLDSSCPSEVPLETKFLVAKYSPRWIPIPDEVDHRGHADKGLEPWPKWEAWTKRT